MPFKARGPVIMPHRVNANSIKSVLNTVWNQKSIPVVGVSSCGHSVISLLSASVFVCTAFPPTNIHYTLHATFYSTTQYTSLSASVLLSMTFPSLYQLHATSYNMT